MSPIKPIHPLSRPTDFIFFEITEINSTMAAAPSPADFSAKKYFDLNPLGTTRRQHPRQQHG
jgi:hypothetical protein